MENPRKLKRAVIKEELVALTGHWARAVILNQLLYWSERTNDTDRYLEEEKQRSETGIDVPLTHGWIYKSAEELSAEIMLEVSPTTVRKHVRKMVGKGWVDERNNPHHTWDRRLQYRPNLLKIQSDLHELGYNLDGYKLVENLPFKEFGNANKETGNQFPDLLYQFPNSLKHYQRLHIETITDTNTEGTCVSGIEEFVQEVIETWNSSLQELPDLNLTDKTTIRMKDKLVLPNKRNGKMTKYEKDIRGKLRDLYKDEDFREEWKEALLTALDTPGMISRSWFKLHWFIGTGKNGNQPGYVRCLIREFAWADKEVVNTPRFNQPIEHVPGNPGF